MIGIDTNILVRYLAQDDPGQAVLATDFIERGLSAGNPGFISLVAMVETAWVLDRAYGMTAREIASALERVLQADVLVVQEEQAVFASLVALREGRGSFADALIGRLGADAGCSHTVTFDRRATRLPDFREL